MTGRVVWLVECFSNQAPVAYSIRHAKLQASLLYRYESSMAHELSEANIHRSRNLSSSRHSEVTSSQVSAFSSKVGNFTVLDDILEEYNDDGLVYSIVFRNYLLAHSVL